MDSSVVLFMVIVGLVVGGLTALLAVAYVSTEKERGREEQERRVAAAAKIDISLAVPGFFPPVGAAATPIAFVFDDGVVRQLESHLRSEQAAVAQFVHHPSIDNLYRQPTRTLHPH